MAAETTFQSIFSVLMDGNHETVQLCTVLRMVPLLSGNSLIIFIQLSTVDFFLSFIRHKQQGVNSHGGALKTLFALFSNKKENFFRCF